MNNRRKQTSLERYEMLGGGFGFNAYPIRIEDIRELLSLMEEELIVHGGSPLLEAAYATCCKKYRKGGRAPGLEWLVSSSERTLASSMDGEYCILYLGKAISGTLVDEDLVDWSQYIFRNFTLRENLWNEIRKTMDSISNWMVRRRRELLMAEAAQKAAGNPAPATAYQQSPQSRQKDSSYNPALAEKQAQEIMKSTQQQRAEILADAQRQKKQILDSARAEADQLKASLAETQQEAQRLAEERGQLEDCVDRLKQTRARLEAEGSRLEAEARQRAGKLTSDIFAERHAQEQEAMFGSLDAMRKALQDINSQMRNMEKNLTEANTRKASRQLMELYDSIADLRDSAENRLEHDPSDANQNTVHNMNMLLMLVVDALSEYGITNINTLPGEPFSGKYHEVDRGRLLDPQSAVVARSLRDGFSWGNQVIRKEKITLQEEK